MKADLTQTGEFSWMLQPESGPCAQLEGHTKEQAVEYAIIKGFTSITLWDGGKQLYTVDVPKQTMGKQEATGTEL